MKKSCTFNYKLSINTIQQGMSKRRKNSETNLISIERKESRHENKTLMPYRDITTYSTAHEVKKSCHTPTFILTSGSDSYYAHSAALL